MRLAGTCFAALLALAACDSPAPAPAPAPTPTSVPDKEIERAIQARSIEQGRAVEQKLANQRANADFQRAQSQIPQRLQQEIDRRRAEAAGTRH